MAEFSFYPQDVFNSLGAGYVSADTKISPFTIGLYHVNDLALDGPLEGKAEVLTDSQLYLLCV
jgi:hypothetical protein